MFSVQESVLLGEAAFRGGCGICMATLMLSDLAKEAEKLRVSKMSDLRGWNSWCGGFALVFIGRGQGSHHDERARRNGLLLAPTC